MPAEDFMRRWSFVTLIPLLCGATACKKDEIQVYRVAKETPAPAMPMGAPPAGGAMPGAENLAGAADRNITWTLPAGWTEKPASQMRVGSFSAKASNGREADVSVVSLGGGAGGDLANVNRWRGQIGLPPLAADQLDAQSKWISPAKRRMRLVDYVSTEPSKTDATRTRIIAAIYAGDDATWFFKMTGEDQATASLKPSFLAFLESLKFK
jgi:hypothetical protein